MAKIKVSGELEVATAEGKLADTAQVFDSPLQKNQQHINKEFKEALAKLTRKKRIYMNFAYNSSAFYAGSWLYASPGETVYMAIHTPTTAKSVSFTVVPLNTNKGTPTSTVTYVGTYTHFNSMVFWKVAITMPEDVEDNDIYLYKYTTSTT